MTHQLQSPMASLSLSASLQSIGDGSALPEFVNLDNKYLCSLCKEVLREPWQTPCGHRMCRSCLDRKLDESGPQGFPCPANEDECVNVARTEVIYLELTFCWYKT